MEFLMAGAVALIAFLGGALVAFILRPIATTRWFRRNAMLRAGFRAIKIQTTIGLQSVLHGGSGPLLVLLHGAGDNAGTWYRIAPQLEKEYEVIAVDLAGHGNSDPPRGVLELGTLRTALEQVLEAEAWRRRPLILVGNSLGAWMTMLYAQRHPERVQQVVLVNGGPLPHVSEIGIMPKTREDARRAFDAVLDPSAPKRPNFVLDDLVRTSTRGPIARLIAAGDDSMAQYLLEGQLGQFSMPVDLIWGASDRLIPLSYAERMQAQLPNCTLSVIDRCGHAPQLERPYALLRELSRVLQLRKDANASVGSTP